MNTTEYDILIVGGGIHGVGVAQAGAAAGYRVLLVESRALAWGTSRRSSKLIHGGLRYLETGQVRLVRESLRERRLLLENAPDLVRLVPFLIPVYEDSRRPPWQIRAGLSLYSLLGGFRRMSRFRKIPVTSWPLSDGLRSEGLKTVFQYWDAQTHDELLTQAVMQSALSLGAELACPAELRSATRTDDGYRVELEESGGTRHLHVRTVVNAAGPWLSEVLERIAPAPPSIGLELVQGAHIVVEGELHEGIYYTESPTDRRAVFVMPWEGQTLVGTTETPFRGDPGQVAATDEEVAYLLETYRRYFPEREASVTGSFAGLRVLPTGEGALNRRRRDTHLVLDDRRLPRLVSIAGGKLTGYRATSEKVLRALRRALPAPSRVADTAHLRLVRPESSTRATQIPAR